MLLDLQANASGFYANMLAVKRFWDDTLEVNLFVFYSCLVLYPPEHTRIP